MSDRHAWFRSRLAAHLLGLLPDAEERELQAHVRECAECAAKLQRAEAEKPDWWEGANHLPVTVLGRWARGRDAFSAEERATIEAHLSSCTSCRMDLADLGGEAELRHEPGPLPGPGPRSIELVRGRGSAAPRWRDWFSGGLVGALATAAAFVLVWSTMRPASITTPPPVVSAPATPAPTAPSEPTPKPPASRPADRTRLRSVRLTEFTSAMRSLDRAADQPLVDLEIARGDTVLALRFEAPGADRGAPVQVTVTDPAGRRLFEGRLESKDFDGEHVLLLERAAGFTTGIYRAHLVTLDAAAEPADYPFRVRFRH